MVGVFAGYYYEMVAAAFHRHGRYRASLRRMSAVAVVLYAFNTVAGFVGEQVGLYQL